MEISGRPYLEAAIAAAQRPTMKRLETAERSMAEKSGAARELQEKLDDIAAVEQRKVRRCRLTSG